MRYVIYFIFMLLALLIHSAAQASGYEEIKYDDFCKEFTLATKTEPSKCVLWET